MKKFGKLFLAVFVALFSSITIVNAASKCDYDEQVELNNVAANIKVSYEEAEEKIDPSLVIGAYGGESEAMYYYFKVQIYNMPENVYLKITNDVNNEVKYLYYRDSQSGVVSFDWKDLDKVVNFTITAYSNEKTSCPNEEYRVIYLTLPRFNTYSDRAKCSENEDFYLCQKYITSVEEIDEATFEKEFIAFSNSKIEEEKKQEEELNKTWYDKLDDFIEENKITIIVISTIIVVGGVVTTVIVIKKRRSRLI